MSNEIIIDSTGWYKFKIDAISNYAEEIKIGERIKKDGNKFYTKSIEIKIDTGEMMYQRDLINHYLNECDSHCEFCKNKVDD